MSERVDLTKYREWHPPTEAHVKSRKRPRGCRQGSPTTASNVVLGNFALALIPVSGARETAQSLLNSTVIIGTRSTNFDRK